MPYTQSVVRPSRLWLLPALLAVALCLGTAHAQVLNEYSIDPSVHTLPGSEQAGVDAGGDINLQIPILTVPGRGGLDYTITLGYQSSITPFQGEGWIGLGWSFNPGSITRQVQGGAPWYSEANGVDFLKPPCFSPDVYFVTIPGRGTAAVSRQAICPSQGDIPPPRPWFEDEFFEFDGDGNVHGGIPACEGPGACHADFYTEKFKPWLIQGDTSTTPITLAGATTSTTVTDEGGTNPVVTGENDYVRFYVTTADGTRYVYGAPSISTFHGPAHGTIFARISQNYVSTWRLVAILGRDYTDQDMIPSPSSKGSWVRLDYSALSAFVDHDYGGENWTSFYQGRKLRRIVTPTHVAVIGDDGGNMYPNGDPDESEIVDGAGINGGAASLIETRFDKVTLYRLNSNPPAAAAQVSANYGTRMREVDLVQGRTVNGRWGADSRRLLTQIKIKNESGEPEPGYVFAYTTPNPGSMYSEVFDQYDDFGYYNKSWSDEGGNSQPGTTGGYTDPSAWSMTKVTYPTGMWEQYTYEADRIDTDLLRNDKFFGACIPYSIYNGENGTSVTRGYYSFVRGRSTDQPNDEECPTIPQSGELRGKHQGGVRVKQISRGGPSVEGSTTRFEYGDGAASGIPSYFWNRAPKFVRCRPHVFLVPRRGGRLACTTRPSHASNPTAQRRGPSTRRHASTGPTPIRAFFPFRPAFGTIGITGAWRFLRGIKTGTGAMPTTRSPKKRLNMRKHQRAGFPNALRANW